MSSSCLHGVHLNSVWSVIIFWSLVLFLVNSCVFTSEPLWKIITQQQPRKIVIAVSLVPQHDLDVHDIVFFLNSSTIHYDSISSHLLNKAFQLFSNNEIQFFNTHQQLMAQLSLTMSRHHTVLLFTNNNTQLISIYNLITFQRQGHVSIEFLIFVSTTHIKNHTNTFNPVEFQKSSRLVDIFGLPLKDNITTLSKKDDRIEGIPISKHPAIAALSIFPKLQRSETLSNMIDNEYILYVRNLIDQYKILQTELQYLPHFITYRIYRFITTLPNHTFLPITQSELGYYLPTDPLFNYSNQVMTKESYNNTIKYVFVAGVEGSGHHFFQALWQNIQLLDDNKDIVITFDPIITRYVWYFICGRSIELWKQSYEQMLFMRLRNMHQVYLRHHPNKTILIFLNTLGDHEYGMLSYPNMESTDKKWNHPSLLMLVTIFDKMFHYDLRIIHLNRDFQLAVDSTIRRNHALELVGHENNSYFQLRILYDNFLILHHDIQSIASDFVVSVNYSLLTSSSTCVKNNVLVQLAHHLFITPTSLFHAMKQIALVPQQYVSNLTNTPWKKNLADIFTPLPSNPVPVCLGCSS